MISQKIKTLLYPILGLDVDPDTPEGDLMLKGNVQPTLGLLLGKSTNGTVLIEGTVDGSLKVADTGSGLDAYEVFNDTATDANVELNISQASASITIEVTAFDLTISFQKADASWGGDIDLTVGWHSFDFTFSDVRVKNETGGGSNDSIYQIIVFS